MLAISRPGNCFAASERTTREVNDTRRLSKYTAEYHFVTPRIWVTESSSTLLSFLKGPCPTCLLVVTKQSTLSPPAFFLVVFTKANRRIGTAPTCTCIHRNRYSQRRLLDRRLQNRSQLVLGMRKYLTNTTTHVRSHNVSSCCAINTILFVVEVQTHCRWIQTILRECQDNCVAFLLW